MAKTFEQRLAERIKKMKLDYWQKRKADFKKRREEVCSAYMQQCIALKQEENELTWRDLLKQELQPEQLAQLKQKIALEMQNEKAN